ncbi:hypothetical protein ABPG74_013464 [Tetrahymena malaccensis]
MITKQIQNQPKVQKNINFQIIHDDYFLVQKIFDEEDKQILKNFEANYDNKTKGYVLQMKFYTNLIEILTRKYKVVNQIPYFVFSALQPIQKCLKFHIENQSKQICYDYNDVKTPEKHLPTSILKQLFNYQKEGIRFGMMNKCRILIADEMGVGKTIQAICLAFAYLNNLNNKMIVICPSSLKFYWKEEIDKWYRIMLNGSKVSQYIQVFQASSDQIEKQTKILICSYDIIQSSITKIEKYNAYLGIADEAHYLKNPDTKRSKAITPYLQQLKHVILLTGTPAFAKPQEMFSLVSILRPDVFTNFLDYGKRYCNPKKSNFHNGLDYSGSSNELELHFLLTRYMMIRRLKKDVLNELPDKKRKKIMVSTDSSIKSQISQILKKVQQKTFQILMNPNLQFQNDPASYFNGNHGSNQFQSLKMCYQLSGMAKQQQVLNYLEELLKSVDKVIVFAEHKQILDNIEKFANDRKKNYIRIDGSVRAEERSKRVQSFENNKSISIAILSFGAASQGITLTSASNILFAEMHWTPAIMQQAEDRAHRIGQKNPVTCHYLIGEETLDNMLYKKIEQKLQIVGAILDGKTVNLKFDESDLPNQSSNSINEQIPSLELQFMLGQQLEQQKKINDQSNKFKKQDLKKQQGGGLVQQSILNYCNQYNVEKNKVDLKKISQDIISCEENKIKEDFPINEKPSIQKRSRKQFEQEHKLCQEEQFKPEKQQLKAKTTQSKNQSAIVID